MLYDKVHFQAIFFTHNNCQDSMSKCERETQERENQERF